MKFQHNYHYVPKELITNEAIHCAVVYALEKAGGVVSKCYGAYGEGNRDSKGLCAADDNTILWSRYFATEPVTLQQLFNHEDFKWPEGMDKIGYVDNRVVFYNGQEYSYIGDPSRYRLGYSFNLELHHLTLIATKENKGENTMSNQFTKDMLVAGKHVVEYRDGALRLVLETNDGLTLSSLDSHRHGLHDYLDNLLHLYGSFSDIVKVYTLVSSDVFTHLLHENNLELVWERKEKSKQEIEYEKLMEQISELQKQAEKLKP